MKYNRSDNKPDQDWESRQYFSLSIYVFKTSASIYAYSNVNHSYEAQCLMISSRQLMQIHRLWMKREILHCLHCLAQEILWHLADK